MDKRELPQGQDSLVTVMLQFCEFEDGAALRPKRVWCSPCVRPVAYSPNHSGVTGVKTKVDTNVRQLIARLFFLSILIWGTQVLRRSFSKRRSRLHLRRPEKWRC